MTKRISRMHMLPIITYDPLKLQENIMLHLTATATCVTDCYCVKNKNVNHRNSTNHHIVPPQIPPHHTRPHCAQTRHTLSGRNNGFCFCHSVHFGTGFDPDFWFDKLLCACVDPFAALASAFESLVAGHLASAGPHSLRLLP